MKVLFFEEIPSTQEALKDHFANSFQSTDDPHIMVACERQTKGKGRRGNDWKHFDDSLAISFSLPTKKSHPLTLYPLKMAVMVLEALHQLNPVWDIKLKWPNDIINSKGEKLGGIICQALDEHILFGLGLNFSFGEKAEEFFETDYGHNFLTLKQKYKKQDLAEKIFAYVIERNDSMTNEILKEEWDKHCFHMQKAVEITEGTDKVCGTFIGIGEFGEALVSSEGETKKVYNGSLRMI